ncbi:MAG: ABC transporter ATP-binding protein [Planctomycetota bacterium]
MRALEIAGLEKSYLTPDGEKHTVVRVPEFALDAGAHIALQGSSGSGKTTFLHLIAGILAADNGRIRIAGEEITGLSEAERDRARAQHIGYVFQTFNLLQGYTALENVTLAMRFGAGVDRAKAESLLERVGLGDRMAYRPRQLSVGQQQRVAVARALANGPQLVLADEPTGNLDRTHAFEAVDLIREVCRENEAALLLVSHDAAILDRFEDRRAFTDVNQTGDGQQSGMAGAGA